MCADSTILLVDDEEHTLHALSKMLAFMGYTVLRATDGEQALELYHLEHPDITFTDVCMPHMDGFAVLRGIRERDPDAEVILITGYDHMEISVLALRAGASDILPKPIDKAVLMDALQRADRRLHRVREFLRMQRALLESEQQYRITLDSLADAIFIVDAEMRLLLVNKTFRLWCGAVGSDPDMLGKNFLEIIPSFPTGFRDEYQQVFDSAQALITEGNVQFKDTQFICRVQKVPVIEDGRVVKIITILHDITERRRAEAQLKEYGEHLEALVQDRTLELANANVDLRLEGAERNQVEAALAKSAARYRYMFQSAAISLWEQDFSELRCALDALRAAGVSDFRSYLNAHPEFVDRALYMIRVVDVNDMTLKLFGATCKDELLGPLHKTTVPEAWPHFREEILAIAERLPYFEMDSLARTLSGDTINVTVSMTISKDIAQSDTLLVSLRDITERTQAVAALHDAHAQLERRVAARTGELVEINQRLQREIAERQRVEVALRRYANDQAALYAVTSVAASSLEANELFEAVLDVILLILEADAGWVVLPGALSASCMHVVAWRGVPQDFMNAIESCSLDRCPIYANLWELRPQDQAQFTVKCPHLRDEVLAVADLHNCIGLPLYVGDKPQGVLYVAWSAPHQSDNLDRELLTAIGHQVSMALRNAQLYSAARQVDSLQVLNTISAAANSSLDPDVVLRQVIALTCPALNVEEGAILLRDENSGDLVFAQTLSTASDLLLGKHLTWGTGVAGWVAQNRQAHYVNDVYKESRWFAGVDEDTGFKTRSLVCAPLIYHGKLTGVIEVVNKHNGDFSDEDMRLLEAVASVAAAAIENAYLFTATRARAEELATLNKISLALTASLDPQKVVEAALSHVRHLFHAVIVTLLQRDLHTNELRFVHVLHGTALSEVPLPFSPQSIAEWALSQRRSLLVEDAHMDVRFLSHALRLPAKAHALMAVPLVTLEREIGIVLVMSEQVGAYSMNDLRILQSVAAILTVALDNARLYEDLKVLLHEREMVQAQLIHAEKMTALGRLAASIAHEINNPLQAVLGCMRLAEEEIAQRFRKDKLERHLGVAVNEVKRVSCIVRRMYDFYRRAREEWQPTNVHAALESVLDISAKQLQHSGVKIERFWADDLPIITANPDHLKQVFLNLLLNAIDAMPQGGTLCIRTELDCQPEADLVCIAFSDTGIGISSDSLSHIFEPFFTTKDYGTGLGLSISYGIIEAHKGKITVSTQAGAGSTFTVMLPLEQAQQT